MCQILKIQYFLTNLNSTLQPIAEFIDKIASKCKSLQKFEYVGSCPGEKITNDYPIFKNEEKFTKLDSLKIEFTLDDYNIQEGLLIAENFKKYLTAKCPSLKKAIQIETKEDARGFINCRFESK